MHLRPDRENRLGAALDVVFDAQLAEPLLDGHQEPRDEGPALLGAQTASLVRPINPREFYFVFKHSLQQTLCFGVK